MGSGGGGGSCDDDDHVVIMPEDVLIQILLCLPVISLLRFKSVCKSWRCIIESPFFIHLHATTTTKSGGSSGFLFFRFGDVEEEEEMKRNVFTLSGEKFEVFEDLGRPSVGFGEGEANWSKRKTFYDGIIMVGCCNGIICLDDSLSKCVVALWNPAIKQFRFLPKPSNLIGNLNNEISDDYLGFGIDVETKDYKLLLITTLAPSDVNSDEPYDEYKRTDGYDKTKFPFARNVHVYSLSSDSWKCLEDATLSAAHPNLDITESCMQLNGSFFFLAKYYIQVEDKTYNSGLQAMPLIISFDFTQEIFRTIELPYNRRTKFDLRSYQSLLPFGQKIALSDFTIMCDEFDIWVLNEQQQQQQQQGVIESWTKFYTFGPYNMTYSPICIVDNGEFAIMHGYDPCQDGQVLHLFNLSTGETNVIQCGCEGLRRVVVYKPSLVSIGGNGATDDKPICGV